MIGIEYVCTGNNGRSPMAEAIAENYVEQRGLVERVMITSSGIGRNTQFLKQGDALKGQKIDIIRMGLANDLYKGRIKEVAERVVSGGLTIGDEFVDRCADYLVKAEAVFRDYALQEIGLQANGNYHKPTEPRGDVNLVLAMSNQNAAQVRQIYLGSSFTPLVEVVTTFAGEDGEITNPFCQLLPAYQRTRSDLLRVVPKTIDRAVEEFGRKL